MVDYASLTPDQQRQLLTGGLPPVPQQTLGANPAAPPPGPPPADMTQGMQAGQAPQMAPQQGAAQPQGAQASSPGFWDKLTGDPNRMGLLNAGLAIFAGATSGQTLGQALASGLGTYQQTSRQAQLWNLQQGQAKREQNQQAERDAFIKANPQYKGLSDDSVDRLRLLGVQQAGQQQLAQTQNAAELQRQLALAAENRDDWVDIGTNAGGQILQRNKKTNETRAVGSIPAAVINNGTGQAQFDKTSQQQAAEFIPKAQADIQAAQGQLNSLTEAQKALDSGTSTGGIYDQLDRYASVLGINTAGMDQRAILNSIGTQLTTANLPPGSASDTDVKLARAAALGTDKSPEANRALIKVLKAKTAYNLDYTQQRARYAEQNKSLAGFNYQPSDTYNQTVYPGAPSIGAVDSGYVYQGGDPSAPSSWKKQ